MEILSTHSRELGSDPLNLSARLESFDTVPRIVPTGCSSRMKYFNTWDDSVGTGR